MQSRRHGRSLSASLLLGILSLLFLSGSAVFAREPQQDRILHPYHRDTAAPTPGTDGIRLPSDSLPRGSLSPSTLHSDAVAPRRAAGFFEGRGYFFWTGTAFLAAQALIIFILLLTIRQRHKAEKALQQSEKRYKDLTDFLPQTVFEMDPQGNLTFANRHAFEAFGYSREDFDRGLNAFDTLIPENRGRAEANVRESLAGKNSGNEYTARRKDGSLFPVVIHAAPILKDGQPAGLRGIIVDITDLKRAEEALRESEQRYRLLFDYAPIGILHLDGQGTVLDCNEKLEKILGIPREQVLGLDPATQLLDSRILPAVQTALDGESGYYEGEYAPVNPDRVVALRAIFQRIPSREPLFSGAIGLIEDITERKRMEEALREREKLFSEIFELSPELIVIGRREDGRFIQVNDAFVKTLGFRREESLGKPAKDLGLWADPSDGERFLGMLREKGSVRNIETRLRRKSGEVFPALCSTAPLEIRGEECFMAILIDITERKQAEEDRKKLLFNLQQAQKMEAIGTLAGGIAHDFNNILAGILGYAEMALLRIPDGDPVRRNLDRILTACARARDLVKQILVFGRHRSGDERLPLDVVPLLKESVRFLRASLPTTIEIKPSIEIKSGWVLADPTQVQQVLFNLCTNAAHAMEERGGLLEIGVGDYHMDPERAQFYEGVRPGPHVRLTVRDNGHGMDAATIERIFDPYFTTKEPGKGTGLGLAVVHGIVKQHEGAIAVSSEPEQGTTFQVFFPCIESSIALEDEEEEPLLGGTERILFVDDEESLVDVGTDMLKQLGYKVTPKSSPVEAWERFRRNPHQFDLVITDYTMPLLTGVDMAREMIHIRPDIPIILCTGFSESITEEKALKAGIRRFVMKPLRRREIARAIRQVLDSPASSPTGSGSNG